MQNYLNEREIITMKEFVRQCVMVMFMKEYAAPNYCPVCAATC